MHSRNKLTSDITTLHENCKFCATSWPILGFVWKDDISSGIPSFAGGDQNCSVHELLEGDFNAIMFNHTVVKQFQKGDVTG